MENTKIIIASCSEQEAITACLIKNAQAHGLNVELVLLEDLLNQFEIFDCVSDKGTTITWHKPDGAAITNKNCILVNRIMQVPEKLFVNFYEHDQFYAQREFEAYLGFSLNAFVGFSNQSPNGLCGQFLSLPQQWDRISGMKELVVPDYYWGLTSFNRLKERDRLVYSTIYNLFNWSIESTESKNSNENQHVFCFVKPIGFPTFICFIGGKTLITTQFDLNENVLKKIGRIIAHLSELFDYFAFELLLFIQDEIVTFGCINLEIIKSVENPSFESFVCLAVTDAIRHRLDYGPGLN